MLFLGEDLAVAVALPFFSTPFPRTGLRQTRFGAPNN
jgi:hypothetical protein